MKAQIPKPWFQFLIIQLLAIAVVSLFQPESVNGIWTILGVFYILFILVNSLSMFKADKPWQYFWHSLIYSFESLLVAYIIVEVYVYLSHIQGSSEGSMVFLSIIYHPFLLLLVLLIRTILKRFITKRQSQNK